MPEASEKTKAEIHAGAVQLAKIAGDTALPPGYMEALIRVHERSALIKRWEREGKLTMESTKRYTSEKNVDNFWIMLYHVKDGPTFDDAVAQKMGGSPSELLVANIALALQAQGIL